MTVEQHIRDFVRMAFVLTLIVLVTPVIIAVAPLLILGAGLYWLVGALYDLKRGYTVG
jgi:hypothetical protein